MVTLPTFTPRKPKWRIILANLLQDRWSALRFSLGHYESTIGSTHSPLSTDQSVAYIRRVYEDYANFGELSSATLSNKSVLEIGPGDNLGVALKMHAVGAREVVCLDKFRAMRSAFQQQTIYRELRSTLNGDALRRFDNAMLPDHTDIRPAGPVQYMCGVPIEAATKALEGRRFDLIVSRAVLWEVFDIERALCVLDTLLLPGGKMVHKIACLDWMFRQDGYHPLEFMTIPTLLYEKIARNSGKCNRKTIAFYRKMMALLGYEFKIHILRVIGEQREFPIGTFSLASHENYREKAALLVDQIRPRLQPEFSSLSTEDLVVEDMFLVATKPYSTRPQRYMRIGDSNA